MARAGQLACIYYNGERARPSRRRRNGRPGARHTTITLTSAPSKDAPGVFLIGLCIKDETGLRFDVHPTPGPLDDALPLALENAVLRCPALRDLIIVTPYKSLWNPANHTQATRDFVRQHGCRLTHAHPMPFDLGNMLAQAAARGESGPRRVVDQRLKRFVQFTLPDRLVARFVLAYLQDEQQLLLVLDRTNWKWGSADINILLLSVRWQTFSFPLVWTVLPHGGNSNMATRIALVERLLPLLQGRRLFLTADREFVGSAWFVALRCMNLSPVIRLRAARVVEGSPVWVRFKKLQSGELRVWDKPVHVYDVSLRVLACQNASRETLFLAYQGHAEKALKRYALRWTAENMHQAPRP